MNLYSMMQERAENDNPIRVGLIGAGKFGTMFLSQVRKLKGIHLIGIADLSVDNAKSNMEFVGWPAEQYSHRRSIRPRRQKATHVSEDWQALVAHSSH